MPEVPAAAGRIFKERLPLAERYAEILADAGTVRGLIGPREVPRLWERHLLNCAVLSEAIPSGRTVADVGSGAGLPGVVLALCRPDLELTLIEPLLRRSTFLQEVVDELGLSGVEVRRARAEELHGRERFDVVVSRAVAPLGKLARWCLPLLDYGGSMLAVKGSSATDELDRARPELVRLGAGHTTVLRLGSDVAGTPVTVVRVEAGSKAGRRRPGSSRTGVGRERGRS